MARDEAAGLALRVLDDGEETPGLDAESGGELVIGFDPATPGLFWLAGQGGYGIQSADGAARLALALLQGTPPAMDGVVPSLMAPDRWRR